MPDRDLRGSVKLIRERWSKPLEPRHLDHVVEVLDRHHAHVRDILCIGIPHPEAITGAITAKPDAVGPLIQELLDVPDARLQRCDIFPIGIPFPELLEMDFRIGR